jgi:hypothetical protein
MGRLDDVDLTRSARVEVMRRVVDALDGGLRRAGIEVPEPLDD